MIHVSSCFFQPQYARLLVSIWHIVVSCPHMQTAWYAARLICWIELLVLWVEGGGGRGEGGCHFGQCSVNSAGPWCRKTMGRIWSRTKKWILINDRSPSIGLEKSICLLFIHAFNGCDVVSAYHKNISQISSLRMFLFVHWVLSRAI
jgi:hypothetical protein